MSNYRYAFLSAEQDPAEESAPTPGSAATIRSELSRVDWKSQIAIANRLEKCSPTFTVEESSSGEILWVSGYGDPDEPEFICDFSYPTIKTTFLGLRKVPSRAGADAQHLDQATAERAVDLFLRRESDELVELLSRSE